MRENESLKEMLKDMDEKMVGGNSWRERCWRGNWDVSISGRSLETSGGEGTSMLLNHRGLPKNIEMLVVYQ